MWLFQLKSLYYPSISRVLRKYTSTRTLSTRLDYSVKKEASNSFVRLFSNESNSECCSHQTIKRKRRWWSQSITSREPFTTFPLGLYQSDDTVCQWETYCTGWFHTCRPLPPLAETNRELATTRQSKYSLSFLLSFCKSWPSSSEVFLLRKVTTCHDVSLSAIHYFCRHARGGLGFLF